MYPEPQQNGPYFYLLIGMLVPSSLLKLLLKKSVFEVLQYHLQKLNPLTWLFSNSAFSYLQRLKKQPAEDRAFKLIPKHTQSERSVSYYCFILYQQLFWPSRLCTCSVFPL